MVVGRKGRRRSHELQTTPSSKDSAMTIASFAGLPLRPLRSVLLAASLALLIISSGAVYAQDKDPVVAKVDGVEIRHSDPAIAEQEAGQLPPMSPEAKQDYLVQISADLILVAKAAEDKKFADSPEFKQKMAFN